MLLNNLPKTEKGYYKKMIKAIGALSRLFSETDVPYLDYRLAENIFCKAFNAENVSRSDASIDAVFKKIGIGIKTFQGNSPQKIAEFNKDLNLYRKLGDKKKIIKISELRNERLEATKRIYKLKEMVYHCIKRRKGKMFINEYPMDLINIAKIKNVKRKNNVIHFKDNKNSYTFSISKSVLMKKFADIKPVFEVNIKVMDNPFQILEKTVANLLGKIKVAKLNPFVILPLYSASKGKLFVPKKAQLNQWNAGGRKRDVNEVYIKIPSWIHSKFKGFFPPRDKPFNLKLPDNSVMKAKVCQDNNKALMSKRNKDLGKWILRDVLELKEKKLVTYNKLQTIGVDSVIIEKTGSKKFTIDFRERGSFEEFIEENK